MDALNYARLISNDARAVYIETDPAKTAPLKEEWEEYGGDIPLVIMESPFRSLVGPLMRYIDTVQKERTTTSSPWFCPNWSRASGGTSCCTTSTRPCCASPSPADAMSC